MAITLPKVESLIVIVSTNKTVAANFGAGVVTFALTEGKYFMDSVLSTADGGANISFENHFTAALDAADAGGTYTGSITSVGIYSLTRNTGSITLKFSDASNTFDERILGYASGVDKTITTVSSQTTKVSFDWYAPIPPTLDYKVPSGVRVRNVSLSGVEFVDEILEFDRRVVSFELLAARYINAGDEVTDNESFVGDRLSSDANDQKRFWDVVKNKNHFRYYP